MADREGRLGVAISGIGWCASQHITAFQRNPHTRVTWLHARNPSRARATLAKNGVTSIGDARITTSYEEVLAAADVDLVSIATPNHVHAEQAVAAARAGKHFVLEKPTGLDVAELIRIRDAVRAAGVTTIVSFELRYNPYLRFVHWLRAGGWLGNIRFARAQYLSHVTDWYSGWEWVRTSASGRSHLLAAGCHAVDALRWCSGLEALEVSAIQTHFTPGYEWPTSILVNLALEGRALGHITSSTDFKMPYTFAVELMGDEATLRHDTIQWRTPYSWERLVAANPFHDVFLEPSPRPEDAMRGVTHLRIHCNMPGSADVSHHPFQDEIDEFVDCVRKGRDTSISVFDAQKTMEICLAADESASNRGVPVKLPLIAD